MERNGLYTSKGDIDANGVMYCPTCFQAKLDCTCGNHCTVCNRRVRGISLTCASCRK